MEQSEIREPGGRHLSREQHDWTGLQLELARWDAGSGTEGLCRLHDHLVFVTFAGATRRTEAVLDDGSRYVGADFPGATTFIPAHHERRAQHRGGAIDYATIRLRSEYGDLMKRVTGRDPGDYAGFTNRPDAFVTQIALALKAEAHSPGLGGTLLVDSLSTSLALHLVRNYSTASPRTTPRPQLGLRRLGRVVSFIRDHLDSDLRLLTLARLADMEIHEFGRAFKSATGIPPHRYVLERRIERAQELLATTTLPIADIAYQVGMSSQSHLTTAFRRLTGTTPHTYRKAQI